MKKITRSIELFCLKHPNFGVPRLMLWLVIGNGLVWLLSQMDRSGAIVNLLAFSPAMILRGQVWRLLTFVFMPTYSSVFYMAISLYFYYFIGNVLEQQWGQAKFTLYYLIGLLLTAVYGVLVYAIFKRTFFLTAQYMNLSMFFAFAALFPEQRVLLFFIIPIKMKWLAIVDAAFFVIEIITSLLAGSYAAALLPIVALLNFLIFCGGELFTGARRYTSAHARANTVNFRREAQKVRSQAQRDYTRKCAVCGRTDKDYPNLEFRYCSRCAGYHCFCQDHINNHVHFTE